MTGASISRVPILFVAPVLAIATATWAAEPRVINDRYKLELIAQAPDIVTPIGMAFDSQGPAAGRRIAHAPAAGRLRGTAAAIAFACSADSDGDGKLDRWSTFADGFQARDEPARPRPTAASTSSRATIVADSRYRRRRPAPTSTSNSSASKPKTTIRTTASAASRQLAGWFALLFGLGENHGFAFTLIGSDGTSSAGTGGLDGDPCATPDGGKLERLRPRRVESVQHLRRSRWAACSRSTTIQTRARRAACSTSCPAATTAICFNMAARARIRCRPGTANCPERCRWSAASAKRRLQSSPTLAACGSPAGATIGSKRIASSRAARRSPPSARSSCKATPISGPPVWRPRRMARCTSATGCYATTKSTATAASGG